MAWALLACKGGACEGVLRPEACTGCSLGGRWPEAPAGVDWDSPALGGEREREDGLELMMERGGEGVLGALILPPGE